jgi:hypothetical protein
MILRTSRRTDTLPSVSFAPQSANATYDSQGIIAIGFVDRVDTEEEEWEVVDRREEWGGAERK